MSDQKGGGFKLNVGLPSIILLLCVLGLSMFAVLTVRAGYNGLKNARTSKKAAQEYYRAEVEADRTRFKIISAFGEWSMTDSLDAGQLKTALNRIDGVSLQDNGLLAYDTRVNDYSHLHTEMILDSFASFRPYKLNIVSHKLVVDDMDGYSGTGFEIEEIELF